IRLAVILPRLSAEITGPGAMFDSSPAQWPGRDMAHFNYRMQEYFVSGTADGQPYTTRLVVRRPADAARFSGLVVAEAMHPIGGAHAFEYNSVYIMDSGHIAVEIATAGTDNFGRFNAARYKDITVTPRQANEILAQVGALVRSNQGPLAGLPLRKMVLWGTSASSGILTRYLPAHAVYRTPGMTHIYDGFMPTSNGSQIAPVDVPMIQVPTQHEFERVATSQQDGDAPGAQFRVYQFAGLSHLDSRNNGARFTQADCRNPLSQFPLEAYMSVALHHLLQWVDRGTVPPRAERVLMDMFEDNDGSLMALDEVGNPRGGIRNPYVDLATVKYTMRNTGAAPAPAPGARGGGPVMGPSLLCNLSAWTTPIPAATLRAKYGSPDNYVRQVEARLTELERAGWSLPVYHDLILADARAVKF
ncbi:MAG: hypothetical protein HOP14_06310, partial [Acidobacteria bacterium]|nr:hypothetical protein [Acidobacteriota bacterium]